MKLVVENNQLNFRVSNKKVIANTKQKLKSGFGLSNVKKRLELSYPFLYTLDVDDQPETYEIELTLHL
jgi:LytS/YehU family sensor histidine kinase